ncbi:MAG: alpha/beta hydrolase, partial [Coleofasciculaceae cyanobacterium]
MSNLPDVLCLSTSSSFVRFNQPLLNLLSRQVSIANWEYVQSQDEACSMDGALVLLHDYLKSHHRPIHLVGHSSGGLLGLLYAQQHPERVKSLTLLAVGVQPAVDWQAYYYTQRQLLPCSRNLILTQMAYNLFGNQSQYTTEYLVQVLEQDLNYSPSPHSLWQRKTISPRKVQVPLMVCGSQDDFIIPPNTLRGWWTLMKEGDRLWECPQGHHFFHYFYPQMVSKEILKFWKLLEPNL